MLDIDNYLRLTAGNYRQAEIHLKDAERELRRLLGRLESSAAPAGAENRPSWNQVDIFGNAVPTAAEG